MVKLNLQTKFLISQNRNMYVHVFPFQACWRQYHPPMGMGTEESWHTLLESSSQGPTTITHIVREIWNKTHSLQLMFLSILFCFLFFLLLLLFYNWYDALLYAFSFCQCLECQEAQLQQVTVAEASYSTLTAKNRLGQAVLDNRNSECKNCAKISNSMVEHSLTWTFPHILHTVYL